MTLSLHFHKLSRSGSLTKNQRYWVTWIHHEFIFNTPALQEICKLPVSSKRSIFFSSNFNFSPDPFFPKKKILLSDAYACSNRRKKLTLRPAYMWAYNSLWCICRLKGCQLWQCAENVFVTNSSNNTTKK